MIITVASLWLLGNAVLVQLPPLPEGDTGIAATYPNDVGIAADPKVVFFDDFEGYSSGSQLSSRWNAGVYHNSTVTTDAAYVYAGSKALQFTLPTGTTEISNGVARTVSPERDVLFLRFYSKFESNFAISGSSHNGGGISAHYFVNGNATPGIPADGTNKFLVEYESWDDSASVPSPGELNFYVYHPEQRSEWGDHFFPDGTVLPYTSIPGNFGSSFVPRPKIIVQLNRWYCYELMVKANTPGQRDGRLAMWLDGELIGDFPNLRLRDVDTLTIDRFSLSFHSHGNSGAPTRKWYDNVVAATDYIGCVSGNAPPAADAGTGPNPGPSGAPGGGSATSGCSSVVPPGPSLLAVLGWLIATRRRSSRG